MQLSVRETARLLGVSEKTIYRWAQKGAIPFTRVHDQYRFSRAEVLQWATARRSPVSPEIFAEPVDLPPPALAETLETGGIFYRIGGDSVASVLLEVVNHLRLPDEVDRDYLYQVLAAREALCSTALGGGVAVPHPRAPVVAHLPRATVTLCFLEQPVDFGALDRAAVSKVFTILSPSIRTHLHLLSRLSFCLRDGRVGKVLDAEGSRDEILEAFREVEAGLPPLEEAPPS